MRRRGLARRSVGGRPENAHDTGGAALSRTAYRSPRCVLTRTLPRRVAPQIVRVGAGTCFATPAPVPDAGSTATTAPDMARTARWTMLEATGRARKTKLPRRGWTKRSTPRQSSVASGAVDLMNEARLGFRKLTTLVAQMVGKRLTYRELVAGQKAERLHPTLLWVPRNT